MAINVTIRNVPDEVHAELIARAEQAGQSLQEHLLAELIELTSRPSAATVLARIRARKAATGTQLPTSEILALREGDRR